MGNYEDSLNDCNNAIGIEPKFIKSYIRKGKALVHLNKYDEALIEVNIGLEFEPANADLLQ